MSAVGGSPSCAWRVGKSCVWDWRGVWRELRREVMVVDMVVMVSVQVRNTLLSIRVSVTCHASSALWHKRLPSMLASQLQPAYNDHTVH